MEPPRQVRITLESENTGVYKENLPSGAWRNIHCIFRDSGQPIDLDAIVADLTLG